MWVVMIAFFAGFAAGMTIGVRLVEASKVRAKDSIISPVPDDWKPEQTRVIRKWVGHASSYNRNGCVGCSANLHMANGQPLDDTKLTIAFNWLPLNTMVLVTNKTNGKQVVAKVTDRHGAFNAKYHWRIVDLSDATARAIGNKTDVSMIEVSEL